MPSYNLGEIMSYSTRRAGRREDLDPSVVSFYANTAYEEVVEIADHEFHEQLTRTSITSGEYKITLPNDFHSPVNVSLYTTASGSGLTLEQVQASSLDQGSRWPLGTPQRYMLYRDWLELDPGPDTSTSSRYSLQIRYRSHATDLIDTTDVPSISTPWRKAVMYLTEAEVMADINNYVGEAIARQRYSNYVQLLENRNAKRQAAEGGRGVHPVYQEVRAQSKRSFDIV